MSQESFDKKMELHALWLQHRSGERATFTWADFPENGLIGHSLEGLDLRCASFYHLSSTDIAFKKCNLQSAFFCFSDIKRATFIDCDMGSVGFSYSILNSSTFQRCRLEGCSFSFCDLWNSDFLDCDHTESEFKWCDIRSIEGVDIHTIDLGIRSGGINYINGFVKIGCQYHSIEDWVKNYKEIGEEYGIEKKEIELFGHALRFLLEKYKPTLDK